jgi:hypothetical protein
VDVDVPVDEDNSEKEEDEEEEEEEEEEVAFRVNILLAQETGGRACPSTEGRR